MSGDPLPPPSAAANSACNDLVFEDIVEAMDLLISYATSVREAAWRGDRTIMQVHLGQCRLALIGALNAKRMLRAVPVDAGGPR